MPARGSGDYPDHRLPTARDRERLLAAGALLRGADLAIGNLEGALTEQKTARKAGASGDFHSFRMPPATAGLLREKGLSVLNLANNHSKDFGEGGLRDTTQALDAAGIPAPDYGGESLSALGGLLVRPLEGPLVLTKRRALPIKRTWRRSGRPRCLRNARPASTRLLAPAARPPE